jgi:hypothetical protein
MSNDLNILFELKGSGPPILAIQTPLIKLVFTNRRTPFSLAVSGIAEQPRRLPKVKISNNTGNLAFTFSLAIYAPIFYPLLVMSGCDGHHSRILHGFQIPFNNEQALQALCDFAPG